MISRERSETLVRGAVVARAAKKFSVAWERYFSAIAVGNEPDPSLSAHIEQAFEEPVLAVPAANRASRAVPRLELRGTAVLPGNHALHFQGTFAAELVQSPAFERALDAFAKGVAKKIREALAEKGTSP